MIHTAPHRVTKRMRTVVECDTEGCPESHYLADDIGVGYGATLMRSVGWHAQQKVPGSVYEFIAHCPAHIQPILCRHGGDTDWDGRQIVCASCGTPLAYAHGQWVTA
jgi:hypothetical protein